MAWGRKRRAAADEDRTARLLDAIDTADAAGDYDSDSPFYETLLFGIAGTPGQAYPPPGHDYPRGR